MNRYHFIAMGILIILGASICLGAGNIMENSSFENIVDNKPVGWQEHIWAGDAKFEVSDKGRDGGKCVVISSESGADASWETFVKVKPFSKYKLAGWIRTEGLEPGTGKGAQLNIHNMQNVKTVAIKDDNDWKWVETHFWTDKQDTIHINCLFGGWGQAKGKAYFDDIVLECFETKDMVTDVTIDTSKTFEPVSKYIYGQFIEHLGRCIYGGIWAEMLEDRKFFYEPGQKDSPWNVIGSKDVISKAEDNPYNNDYDFVFSADGKEVGLEQGSLGLIKDKEYVGRIVFKGDSGILPLRVTLKWGTGDSESETVEITKIKDDFIKLPLKFKAGEATDQGRLRITTKGKGQFSIVAVSLMPADNVKGMRSDVLGLLKELDSPVYRWPGGNFVSGYNWRDGIGDQDKRPTFRNPAWSGLEYNDFGLDEYISFCREINAEPMIAVNDGLGDDFSAAQEVEYANGSADSSMGKWRAKNGNRKPYDVKFWCIGNEMYGQWQLGHMHLNHYVIKHNLFAKAMRKVDDDIILIACGDAGGWYDQGIGDWTKGMFENCLDNMDYISEHFYCWGDQESILAHVEQMSGGVKNKAAYHRRYRQELPQVAKKDVRIALDEWNYWYGPQIYGELGVRYRLKDALGIAVGLNEMVRNSDLFFMANYAQTVNVIGCIKTTKTEAAFETTALPLIMYRKHFGTVPVEVTGEQGLMDITAAMTEDGRYLTIATVNLLDKENTAKINIKGVQLKGDGLLWQVKGDLNEYNEPGREDSVKISEQKVSSISNGLTMPGYSINLYRFELE